MVQTKPFPIRLRPIIHEYLKELVRCGAYGQTRSDVMRKFIENGVSTALEAGVLEKLDVRAFGENLEENLESNLLEPKSAKSPENLSQKVENSQEY